MSADQPTADPIEVLANLTGSMQQLIDLEGQIATLRDQRAALIERINAQQRGFEQHRADLIRSAHEDTWWGNGRPQNLHYVDQDYTYT